MTYGLLKQIFEENNIPDDAKLMSDSGWECDPTEMDGIYYCEEDNEVVFTQGSLYDSYYASEDWWKCLYNEEEDGLGEWGGELKENTPYICPKCRKVVCSYDLIRQTENGVTPHCYLCDFEFKKTE